MEQKDKYQVFAEYRGISDIFSGISKNEITLGYGHNTEYWLKDGNRIDKEDWAQYGRILYENDLKVRNMFESIFINFKQHAKIA